ncbi:hypothetical protein BJV82DRAFT_105360 [Fennellomyces sp. T-0311]|nr:hypothetical protein BJV82DRAFT_105360 [Fennellomyces sp. T-0311]
MMQTCILLLLTIPLTFYAQAQDTNSLVVQLPSTTSGMEIPPYSHGFSLEMSHWTTVFGTRTDKQGAGFLQLLRNIQDRRGALMIRLGGNSQDAAYSDETISQPIAKTGEQAVRTNSGATTFNIKVHSRMFDYMRHLSDLISIKWTFGLNFEKADDMNSARQLGKLAIDKLGDLLYAVQIGNEPDLYAKHGLRNEGWGVEEYAREWMDWASKLLDHFKIERRNIFTGGVICCTWHLQDLLDSGYFERSKEFINSITVQKYSSNACFGVAKGAISDYLSHDWITSIPRENYAEPVQHMISQGKEIIMGETNTAACGGILGISDTYVSALWWVDWQLFLYSLGFASIELQLGGPTAHYNPMSKIGGSWIANPIYYGSLVTAEALGPPDARPHVMHIDLPSDSHVAYGIFHQGHLRYAVLINLDPDNDAVFPLQGAWDGVESLKVKRLVADGLEERHSIHWAGQTLHNVSDGVLLGDIQIDQVPCVNNRCEVTLPKASVALVGHDFDAFSETTVIDKPYDVHDVLGSGGSGTSLNPLVTTTSGSHRLATSRIISLTLILFQIIRKLVLY